MSKNSAVLANPFKRALAGILSFLVVTTSLVVLQPPVVANAADPVIAFTANVSSSILAGETATVSLSANNFTVVDDLYNLSFSHELPVGVTYVPGSTEPSMFGNPRIITVVTVPDPLFPLITEENQVLIWENVSDLIAGSTTDLSFDINPDPLLYPVGSEFFGTSHAYANSDPRFVPNFDSVTGQAIPGANSYTNSDTVSPTVTGVSAISVRKTNPNPESELMRGVHDQTSTFAITVRNTDQANTDDVIVVDFLPAGLEFLGCGGVDNTTVGEEYTGSGSLASTPVPADCVVPYAVETVLNPSGLPAGVYTRVEWRLGTLTATAPDNVVVIRYAVSVPLFENTMSFAGGTPTDVSLLQTANLDNNSGSSTRHVDEANSYRNTVNVVGEYTGLVAPSTSSTVTASAANTISATDLSVVTTTSSGNFVAGDIFTYNMMVRTGEYASASSVVVSDTLPDGICPIVPAGTTIIGSLPADCNIAGGSVTGATIVSVTVNGDGSYTTVFDIIPSTLAPNSTVNITYTALFRESYEGGTTDPTASGDSFSTETLITGVTTAVPETGITPAEENVEDDSGSGHSSSTPTIEKLVLPRTNVGSVSDCVANFGSYVADASVVPGSSFVQGDRMCFQLTVNFSSTTDTRNAQVTDFVPVGTEYESYEIGSIAEGNTLNPAQVSVPTDPDIPTWLLGETVGGNPNDLFVARGNTLVLFVSAIVVDSAPTSEVDITANLMKYVQENTVGQVYALRAQADFGVSPAPTMNLTKGITNLNGVAQSSPYPTTGVVQGTQYADFILTPSNTGSALVGNDQTVKQFTVWDALPSPVECVDVSLISGLGTCVDNFASLSGSFTGQSAIIWTVTEDVVAGASATPLTYRVTFPAVGMTVGSDFTNNASIVNFNLDSTGGSVTIFYPEDSLDEGNSSSWNTVSANASATVTTPNVSVAKTLNTPVVAPNNTALNAVPGELVDYTYSVTIPARTTVYNGSLNDTLPTGLTRLPSTTDSTTIPNGVTTYSVLTGYTTFFDSTYTNETDSPQTFSTTLTGVQVTPSFAGTNITNTVTFRSDSAVTGGTALTPRTTTASLPVTRPAPTVTKTVNSANVSAGQTVEYTLTINNTSGRPAGYDTIVNDCLPLGITFLADVTLPAGITRDAPTAGTGTGAGGNGCATNTNLIRYNVGVLSPATPRVIIFSATIDSTAAGLVSYTNTARVVTSTLNDGVRDATIEAVITSSAANAVSTVIGGTVTKTTTKTTATIGETVPYTIRVTLPAQVNFWNAAIIDTVPTGLTINQATTVISCENVVSGTDCLSDLPAGGSTMTPTATRNGWYLGNVTSDAEERLITLTVDATITDVPGNVIGGVITNRVQLSWMNASGSAPANAGSTFDRSTTVNAGSTANTTIQEPSLSVTKTNTDSTPTPAQDYGYTVAVRNANNANTSTAYNVTVTDTVPTGVVVDEGTISNGGVLTGAGANGGGVITWSGLTIARNATVNLTYTASLADSDTLTVAGLVNTARVTTYSSLPSNGRTYTSPVPTATSTVTPTFPNVVLTKTTPNGTVAYVEQPFSWRLTMTNGVTSATAVSVVAEDVLPQNWIYVEDSAFITNPGTGVVTQVNPTVVTVAGVQTLTWPAIGPFNANTSAVINYQAMPTVDALTSPGIGASNAHTNTFSAIAEDEAGFTQNATASYTSNPVVANAFIGSADLEVTKTNVGTLVAGETISNAWTVLVRNNGADQAVGPFTVSDTITSLPAGVTVGQPAGIGWSCDSPAVDGSFTCERTNSNDTLNSGTSFPVITIPLTVASDVAEGTEIENNVTATALTTDPNMLNNSDVATQTVTVISDLSIEKETSGSVNAGETVTWLVTVTNDGPSQASAPVRVTEVLPPGVVNASASGTGWDCSPPVAGVIVCTMGALDSIAPIITVTADIPSSYVGSLTNNVEVSNNNPDPTPENNEDSTTDTVNTDTTLVIEKSLAGPEVVAGATTTFRFDVNNSGRSDARNVLITDSLPNGLTFNGNVVSITPGWTCSEVSPSPSTVECELSGTLPASGSDTASVSFDVLVPSDLPLDTVVENFATVSADNAPDDTDSALGTTVGVSDLAIQKALTASPVVAGGQASYTLEVTNNGDTDNNGDITVVDTLPEGFTLSSATGTDWTCDSNVSNDVITCIYSSGLPAGDTAPTITVVANIAASVSQSTLVNTATVGGTSDYTDNDLSNNTDDADTIVVTNSVLTVVKTGELILVPGTETVYEITVTNEGLSNARNVTLLDTLPAGLTPVEISGSGWTCDSITLTCEISSLPLGDTVFTVTAFVESNVANNVDLTNVVEVEWSDSSGVTNITDDFTGTTETQVDLVLQKTVNSATVNAGEQLTYTLEVTNVGPSDALGDITIVDTLPAGMSYVSSNSTGNVWTCTVDINNSQVIECVLNNNQGIVDEGTAPTLTITTQLLSSLPTGTLNNEATVSTPSFDTNLSNNTSNVDVNVEQVVDMTVTETLLAGTPRIGNVLTFGYEATNNGPSDAQNVSLIVTFPPGLTEIDITNVNPDWSCIVGATDETGTTVECQLAYTLESGETAPMLELSALINVASYPSFTNNVEVATSNIETNYDNNVDGITLEIPPLVGLDITKDNVGLVQAGETARYVITVTNNGLTEAPNGFTVVDTLPAQLSYVSSEGDTGVQCSATANIVTCEFTEILPVGAVATVYLTVNVASNAEGQITNEVAVSTPDENLSTSIVTATNTANVTPPNLPNTGSQILLWLIIGTMLTLLAGGGLLISRRRQIKST